MFDAQLAFYARCEPRALAFVGSRGRRTYAELDADVDRCAQTLTALGIEPGMGPVSVRVGDAYLQSLCLLALSRLAVASAAGADEASPLSLSDRAQPAATHVLTPDRVAAMWELDPRPQPIRPRDPDGLARVMLSSGSTRKPRRVGLTWRWLDAGLRATITGYAAGRQGVFLPLTGYDSMLGLAIAICAWSTGAAVANGVAWADLPATLERHPAGLAGLTPMHLRNLLADLPPGFEPKPGWRLAVGGGLLPNDLVREARLRLTPDIVNIYGSTEAGLIACAPTPRLHDAPGAVGWVLPDTRVEIVDAEGRPVAAGEQGEVRIRGERVADAYLDDAEASAAAFRAGGFHPGDVGRLLADGRLVIEGRMDDRMNIGGRKILPGPIDEAALDCPGVLDAAAFAVPDEQGMDTCCLAVVQGPGFDRELLLKRLGRLGAELPALRFVWTDEIPRNAMGKVDRPALRVATLAALQGGRDSAA